MPDRANRPGKKLRARQRVPSRVAAPGAAPEGRGVDAGKRRCYPQVAQRWWDSSRDGALISLLNIIVVVLTLGLPFWFAYLDRGVFPRLKWVRPSDSPPAWGQAVVFVGIGLAILIALAAPIAGFHSSH